MAVLLSGCLPEASHTALPEALPALGAADGRCCLQERGPGQGEWGHAATGCPWQAAGPWEDAVMLQVLVPVLGGPFSAGVEFPCGYS